MKKKPIMCRQGDVLLIADETAEAGEAVPLDKGRIVLAYGEATGHAHAIRSKHAILYKAVLGAFMVLELKRQAELLHEEHAPIILPPGKYKVVRQREYVPKELPKWVAD